MSRHISRALLGALACSFALAGVAQAQIPPPPELPPPGEPPPGEPPPGSEPPPGYAPPRDCNSSAGPVTLTKFLARKPGGEFEDAREKTCANLTYNEQPDPSGGGTMSFVSFSFSPKDGVGQDLSSVYPKGTLFHLDFESSGRPPIVTAGAFDAPVARIAGNKLTLQGQTTAVKFAFNQTGPPPQPDCSGPTQTMDSFFGGGMALEPTGSGQFIERMRAYRGGFFGSNAQNMGMPRISSDGASVEVEASGCGDGDPSTLEGFYTGFLPTTGTAEMGLNRSLLSSLQDAAVDQIMKLEDNGAEAPSAEFEIAQAGELQLAPTPGAPSAPRQSRAAQTAPAGIYFDYRLSYSMHRLATTSKRSEVKLAKRCRARKGKLKLVKRGRGAGAKKSLACVVKKRRKRRR